jgi:hypothetical protein
MDIYKLTAREPIERPFKLTGDQFQVIWERFMQRVQSTGGLPLDPDQFFVELKKLLWQAASNK